MIIQLILNPMLSFTAAVPPVCPGCALTSALLVQGSQWLNPWLQIRILHSEKCMIRHQNHSNRTSLWEMRYFCAFSGGHFEKCPPFWILGFFQVAKDKYLRSMCANFGACFQKWDISVYLVAAILKIGLHFEFWNFFRWLTGFIKRAISKEYVCQFWCLFPEMKDSFTHLPHYTGTLPTKIYI